MRPHTDEEILAKAGLIPPPPREYNGKTLFVEVELSNAGEWIKYEVEYEKGVVGHIEGWIPTHIEQL